MTSFQRFQANVKIRYDFDDMFQARYTHSNGEEYDTWVSGTEVMRRLQSDLAEMRLRKLSRLDRKQIEEMREALPDEVRGRATDLLINYLADGIERAIGGNVIGDSLADAVRGNEGAANKVEANERKWRALLANASFRERIVELAWIQLEGSFPEDRGRIQPDDWV